MTLDFSEQTKVKVPREIFVEWVESALQQADERQRSRNEVRRTFQICGLDPHDAQQSRFEQHLSSLGEEALYNALIQGNSALNL